MNKIYPLVIVGAIIGVFTLGFIIAYALMKNKKTALGFERQMKDTELFRRLLHYAKPHGKSFLIAAATMLFSISYDVISPIMVGRIETLIGEDFEMGTLLAYVIAYGGILVVSLVCQYVQAIVLQKVGQKIISALREDTFKHIESLSHAQLNNIPVGTLVTRVTNDTHAISAMFTGLLVNMLKNSLVIVAVFVAMLSVNYFLTLVVLSFVPFVVLFTFIFRRFSRFAFRKVKDATTDVNVFLSENLSGMKITQIFNREERKLEEFGQRNSTLGRAKRRQIFVFGIFRPMIYMLYISSVLCLFYFAAAGNVGDMNLLGQTVTGGVLVTFYMYTSKFFNPLQEFAEQFNRLQAALASAEKIFLIHNMEPQIVDDPDAIELDRVEGQIEFRDVWFAYKEGEWVLKGVSFKVEPKQTVAFVGSTGSGKTTILSLICRNYDIQKGQILIDGIDIKRIKISSLRRHFGQMLQDVFLFSGTIRSNILLRLEGVGDDEVMEACRYVNADHFINKLKDGLDEEVRERGNNFSQGQRQLLSFARTIIHKPSVMILDEATANIDTETELLIQDSLEKMMNVGTMLMVAHRLSTIQHADNIIVLSHGKIVESGSHFDLLEKKGKYYGLYMLQFKKDELKRAN